VSGALSWIRPLPIALLLGIVTATYTFFGDRRTDWVHDSLLHKAELKVLDSKFIVRGRVDIDPGLFIAAGDEKTIQRFGRWGTWDRGDMAKIINNLVAAGADVVAFDMVFSDPPGIANEYAVKIREAVLDDPLSEQLAPGNEGEGSEAPDVGALAERLRGIEGVVANAVAGDAALAEAFEEHSARVVQGFIANREPEPGRPSSDPEATWDALEVYRLESWGYDLKLVDRSGEEGFEGEAKTLQLNELPEGAKPSDLYVVHEAHGDVILPQEQFLDAGEYLGFYSVDPDADGTLRRIPLVYRHGEQFLGSLALNAAALHIGGAPMLVANRDYEGALGRIVLPLEEGRSAEMPVDADGTMLINFYGPSVEFSSGEEAASQGVFRRVSLADIHANEFDKDFVKGKIALVAVTAIGTFDQRVTPFSPNVPGVEVHAAAIQNLISGDSLRRQPSNVLTEMALALLLALVLGVGLRRLPIWAGTVGVLVLGVAWVAADYFWLFRQNLWFHQLPILVQMGMSWAGITLWGYLTEGREKAQLKKEFSTVLAPTVVDQLLENPELAGLGGDERNMTVMFSDIRGFTSMSEKMTPEGLTQFLNEYLTPMTDILIARQGTLDKYMGDAIMAFWGAPIRQEDHAARACLAALDMMESLAELRVRWRKEGKPDIDIGIGLNTGSMRVGFMGSERMRNYTLLGDNVNLGSRLEGVNKQYGTNIIISEYTYAAAKDAIYARELDAIRVKGKREPVTIYELRGRGKPEGDEERFDATFHDGIELYKGRKFTEAIAKFETCIELVDGDQPSKLYIERSNAFLEVPPPDDWDGVFEMKTK
jgi:adenylate cyclase